MNQTDKDSDRICRHCEGKGYTEIRDCAGDIQRTERCSFCEGLGYTESDNSEK